MSLINDVQEDIYEQSSILDDEFVILEEKMSLWENCDQSEPDNHMIYNELQLMVEKINKKILEYEQTVAHFEYLETGLNKGYHHVTN